MSKKTVAIIAEIIPLISAPLGYFLVVSKYDSAVTRWVIAIAFLLAFLGFVFFFIGRWLGLATLFIVGFYALAIFVFAW